MYRQVFDVPMLLRGIFKSVETRLCDGTCLMPRWRSRVYSSMQKYIDVKISFWILDDVPVFSKYTKAQKHEFGRIPRSLVTMLLAFSISYSNIGYFVTICKRSMPLWDLLFVFYYCKSCIRLSVIEPTPFQEWGSSSCKLKIFDEEY